MVSSYPIFLLLFGTTTAFFTFNLSEIADPSTIQAVTYCGQHIWYPYKEGFSFSATNEDCQSQAFKNRTSGYSFVTKDRGAVPYNRQTWYSVMGECRLFYPSKQPMYIFSDGPKWAIMIDYLKKGDQLYCPMNRTSFTGVQKRLLRGSAIGYKYATTTGVSDFCLRGGQITAGCYGLPIEINDIGLQLTLTNSTTLGAEPKFCSLVPGGCGASLPLYERRDQVTYNYMYSTGPVDNTWSLLCYVWNAKNC